jgi:hypothetical protein
MVEIDSKRNVIVGMGLLGGSLGRMGEPETATRLLSASVKFMAQYSLVLDPGDANEIDNYTAHVRERLDSVAYEAAWADGQAMSLEQAIAYALAVGPGEPGGVSSPG